MTNDKLDKARHSLAHLLASAILELYPDTLVTLGPSIDTGFYYDFEFKSPVSEKDFEKIEKVMRKHAKAWQGFVGTDVSHEEAKKIFAGNPYKLELIEGIKEKGEQITTYKSGDFVDLCRGGHVDDMGVIPMDSWKLDRVAGAYWRGDEKNKMLTRIYGLAFETKEDLDAYLLQQEEAKKRDHRKIGKELKLFTISELVGPGLPLLQPNGMIIREEIEDYLWKLHKNKGYQRIWSPHLAKKDLYETSGHAAKFGEELFRVKGGEEDFFMKPMNCPHHMQIFADNQFSYRDMPVRYFEPATVYRYEKAGQLSGLTRVRSITQDDGHLFCRVSQIGQEVSTIVEIIKEFFTTMGMMDGYWVRLSVRGDDKSKYLGDDDVWEKAESALEKAAKENNLNYKIGRDEAAFYGPKLDFMFKDAIGREWQLSTIQCDFNLPEKFNLSFTNEKGEQERPVVIHRAISGSLERFMGVMIEHYAGNFPLWLSPVQVKVIPVRMNHNEYAKKVYDMLIEKDIRAEFDDEDSNLGGKVRDAKNQKMPYWIVIGDKEIEVDKVTLESRDNGQLGQISKEELVSKLLEEITNKK
ncbi:MAG: threonyl-tRNA synthetase [Patescibacteria group bacterium]|jgi:threonyl-tRNA synthetase|nr:threonyl-tRNA synthetase [Patescibacteria group bacterium]